MRMTLLVVVLGAGVYAGTLPLYLFFKVSRPALALGAATEAIAAVGADVAHRDSALDEAVVVLRELDARPTVPSASVAAARFHREEEHGPLCTKIPPTFKLPTRSRMTRNKDLAWRSTPA